MAVNAYLFVDGVQGPSSSQKGWIDILSFSWGASNSSVIGAGSSGSESRAGRADLGNLTIMKVVDKTTPLLFEHCVTGDFIKKVEVHYDKPMGDKQDVYYKILMENAIITSIQHSGSSENPTESISFAYGKLKISYNPENDQGKFAGFIDKGYDAMKLKPW